MTTDTRTSPNTYKTRKPITCLDLHITSLPPSKPYFVAAVWRGDWSTDDCRCRNYYHPSRASLLRINRAQRLLIRRVVNGYVADMPAVTVEPESNLELAQLVTNEIEAAEQPVRRMCAVTDCLDASVPGWPWCKAHLPKWSVIDILRREG